MLAMTDGIAVPIFGMIFSVICAILYGCLRAEKDESAALRKAIDRADEDREEDIECIKQQHKAELEYYKKLVKDTADLASRNGAIAEGLAEDLAALKAYNPDEIEERMKKIHELRAEEERLESIRKMNDAWQQYYNAQMAMLASSALRYGGPMSSAIQSGWRFM